MCGPHHCLGRDAFASGPEILRRLLQLRQNASIIGQGCSGHSPNSANRKHQITRHPWRTSSPLWSDLRFSVHTVIGSIRCECLDHVVVVGERHLRHLLRSYATYYNQARTHLSVNKDAPSPRTVHSVGRISPTPLLGGLHHLYVRV